MPGFQLRGLGFDSLAETVPQVENEHGDSRQRSPLVAARIGVQDGLAIPAALPDPETGSATASGFGSEDALLDLLGALAEGSGERVVDQDRPDPDRDGDQHRRGNE